MKAKLSRITVCICSIIISLLTIEWTIRYFKLAPMIFDYKIFEPMEFVPNPKVCYKMKPYGVCEGVHLNSEGFKDTEFDLAKGRDLVRIVMLGDSITKGTGILLGQTFSDQLENLLNQKSQKLRSSTEYEVMNFGVGGYNIVSEIEVLKEYALKYKPDIAILNYFFNDNEEYSFNYTFFLNKKDVSHIEKNLIYQYYLASNKFRLKRLLLRSHLYLFCWVHFQEFFKNWEEIREVKCTIYKNDIILEKLIELKKLGQRNNFKILICMHPVLDYDTNKPHPNYESTNSIVQKLDIPCINLRLFYQLESKDPKIFLQNSGDRVHINNIGHNLIASVLLNELEREKFINFN